MKVDLDVSTEQSLRKEGAETAEVVKRCLLEMTVPGPLCSAADGLPLDHCPILGVLAFLESLWMDAELTGTPWVCPVQC